VLAVLAGSACAPDLPPIEYETEHLRIATESDAPVCQGSLDWLESHVVWVEGELGLELSAPVEVYFYEDLVESQCADRDGKASGCYGDGLIFTDWTSVPHELVHAVAAEADDADEFFAEGTATAFSENWSEFGDQAPSLGVGLDAEDIDYNAAAHFVRWLYERDGAGPLTDMLDESSSVRGPSHAEKAFEKAYGQSLLDADIEFYDEAPQRYPTQRQCDQPSLEWDGDRAEADIELDCSASDTRGSGALFAARTFDIPADGHYVLELESPATALVRTCQDTILPLGAPAPPMPALPVGEFAGGNGWFPGDWVSSGAHDLYLYEGRYQIDVRLPSDGVTRLRLHRKLGGGVPPD
jgi:hypothetical protein